MHFKRNLAKLIEVRMEFSELIIIAIGVSMDAFAVAICKGLSTKELKPIHYLIVGSWFGIFQALMPLIGYLVGLTFGKYITSFDHWIAFALLFFIGANMVKESLSKEDEQQNSKYDLLTMLLLALATSVDALAVGVTFALLPNVNIGIAISIIGVTTFLFSVLGLKAGNIFGTSMKSKAELAGGIILILMGTKILLEHLGIISF